MPEPFNPEAAVTRALDIHRGVDPQDVLARMIGFSVENDASRAEQATRADTLRNERDEALAHVAFLREYIRTFDIPEPDFVYQGSGRRPRTHTSVSPEAVLNAAIEASVRAPETNRVSTDEPHQETAPAYTDSRTWNELIEGPESAPAPEPPVWTRPEIVDDATFTDPAYVPPVDAPSPVSVNAWSDEDIVDLGDDGDFPSHEGTSVISPTMPRSDDFAETGQITLNIPSTIPEPKSAADASTSVEGEGLVSTERAPWFKGLRKRR